METLMGWLNKTLMGWLNKTLDRSPQEVVEILTEFSIGEPTGFLADDFIHIPITDPVLDQIREAFEKLADDHLDWEPQLPFPEAGAKALQLLIERARALV